MAEERGFNALIQRLGSEGVFGLTKDRIDEACGILEGEAATTGNAATVFLAQALREVGVLHEEHDKYGGISLILMEELSSLLICYLPLVQASDRSSAAKAAKELLVAIRTRTSAYDPFR